MRELPTSPTHVSSSDSVAPWQPMARQDHLVMTEVDDEVLVYDQASQHIHHLNPTSQAVWFLCDGTRTVADLGMAASAVLGVEAPGAVVRLALGQLAEANLLVGVLPSEVQESRQSRREMLRRMALVGGGVALPTLASISAPSAAAASSSCEAQGGLGIGASCRENSQCCTGNCDSGFCADRPDQPPPSTAHCGRSCSSSDFCASFGSVACTTCTPFEPLPGVTLYQCL